MTGSIQPRHDKKAFFVKWRDKTTGKTHHITRYKGDVMKHKAYARKLLSLMQSDWENHKAGSASWSIKKYIGKGGTDVIGYFVDWLETKAEKKPATVKGYNSYFKNWIRPFFEKHNIQLHEIQLDTLDKLLRSIKLTGKGKHNVMSCFHTFMDYAWRSKRIQEMPPFPKKEDYNLVEPVIRWLPEVRQLNVIEAIPEAHRPIFLFVKYHLRRPGEACAMYKIDYDIFNGEFIIRRAVSARQVVHSTKTAKEHTMPCHSNFKDIADKLSQQPGTFMFINPRARKEGQRYTLESLNRLWKAACKKTGEKIGMYSGLKHSTYSQYINEKGLSLSELQMLSGHARIESLSKYAKVEIERKRELLERQKVQNEYKKDFRVI